ncbi:MAG: hypothetical protein R6W70_09875 [bacterium]
MLANKLLYIFYFIFIVITVFSVACSPEDGLCRAEEESASGNSFYCSAAQEHWGVSVFDTVFSYENISLFHVRTERDVDSSAEGYGRERFKKSDYFPHEIKTGRLSCCRFGTLKNDSDCDEWLELHFSVISNASKFLISNIKNGKVSAGPVSPQHVKIVFPETGTFSGKIIEDNFVEFRDKTIVDDKSEVLYHIYILSRK